MGQETIEVEEYVIAEDKSGFQLNANKISFFNQGSYPVAVGYINVMPGDVYQVNYEHPHIIKRKFRILFDLAATPSSASDRAAMGLAATPMLIVQTMNPLIH